MRTKRQPTEEQRAKSAERKERFKAICQRVSAMTEDQRAALAGQAGPRKLSGEPFSVFNSCLLLAQHSAPTICAGFHDWRRAGRAVRKGETGLIVWVPIGRRKENADGGGIGTNRNRHSSCEPCGTYQHFGQTDEYGRGGETAINVASDYHGLILEIVTSDVELAIKIGQLVRGYYQLTE